jgi:hypothetical protein
MSKPLPRLSCCPRCNGPVDITFEYWKPGYLAHDVNWECPLCGAPITLRITGRVVSVTTRDPEGPWLKT